MSHGDLADARSRRLRRSAKPDRSPAPPMTAPATGLPPTALLMTAPPAAPAAESLGNLVEVKSPMIGTFYRSSGQDKPAFVEVGTTIKTGSTVCVIEAMKLFNEIESEVSGTVVKILVNDSTPVEYDQPLFLVEPN